MCRVSAGCVARGERTVAYAAARSYARQMPRVDRREAPGALHHVTSRGALRAPIYLDDRDRERFLAIFVEIVRDTKWNCWAYCLMDNHFHLLLDTPEPNLSEGMHRLKHRYARAFNKRHSRTGHLFEGRFTSIPIERDAHLLEVCRYVVLNPVRAGICATAEDWPWSSYRATAGLSKPPRYLAGSEAAALLGGPRRYRDFVAEGSPAASLGGLLLLAA